MLIPLRSSKPIGERQMMHVAMTFFFTYEQVQKVFIWKRIQYLWCNLNKIVQCIVRKIKQITFTFNLPSAVTINGTQHWWFLPNFNLVQHIDFAYTCTWN